MRLLELFCGIGGCTAAVGSRATVAAAVDVNREALAVYSHNFPHPVEARTIESLKASAFRAFDADLWWLSPPCQPFTERGLRRDVDDPRARPFLVLVERLEEIRPRYVAMENVPGFQGSRAWALLRETLERAGYASVHERFLCPSELGLPNRRRRYYLVAGRERLPEPSLPRDLEPKSVGKLRDPCPDLELAVTPELLKSYEGALSIVDADDPAAVTSCFTSAYGRSHVRSGSYLRTSSGVRRFSPAEILRILGFPESYALPPDLSLGKAWRLVGNSLSLAPVRAMLTAVPELGLRQGYGEEVGDPSIP